MKLTLTQLLGINLALSFGLGAFSLLDGPDMSSFLFASGTIALVVAALNLIIGLGLMTARRREPGKMFLACGGILLLVGVSTCFGGLATMSHF